MNEDFILISLMAFYYFFIVALMLYMLRARIKAVTEGRVSIKSFKSYTTKSPDDLVIIQNHYNNQFQIPVFFGLASLLALSQNTVSSMTLVLAVLFVFSRLIHSYIHLRSNKLNYRALSFFTGVLMVSLMFVEILIRSFSLTP